MIPLSISMSMNNTKHQCQFPQGQPIKSRELTPLRKIGMQERASDFLTTMGLCLQRRNHARGVFKYNIPSKSSRFKHASRYIKDSSQQPCMHHHFHTISIQYTVIQQESDRSIKLDLQVCNQSKKEGTPPQPNLPLSA